MQLYSSVFETIYRILHLPTFLLQYDRFWISRNSDVDIDRSFCVEFASQLALVTAISSKLCQMDNSTRTLDSFSFDSPTTISIIETWLSGLSGKKRAQISTIQTSCLLVLAKQLLPVPPFQLWRCSGELMRSALTLGLHRDPEEFSDSNAPTLQIELRRRLWYTIMELDVQASSSCCMPSLVQTIEYTCRYPSETNDEDLLVETGEHPASEFPGNANASTQIALARSLPLRLQALRLLTQIEPDIDGIDETLRCLEFQRVSLSSFLGRSNGSDAQVPLKSVMLDMCLRGPMISLYTLQIQLLNSGNNAHTQSTARGFLDTALGVMSHSETLDPDLTDHDTIVDGKNWTVFQAIHGDDLIRAAYGACMAIKVITSNTSNITSPEISTLAGPISHWPKAAVRRTVEDVVKTFIKLTPDLRSILKQLWGLVLVVELTRQEGSAANNERRMRAGLQRTLQLCRERYAADGNDDSHLEDEFDSFTTQSTPDIAGLLTSEELNLDTFSFDWNFDPLPNIVF
jgi:hypothetical protein